MPKNQNNRNNQLNNNQAKIKELERIIVLQNKSKKPKQPKKAKSNGRANGDSSPIVHPVAKAIKGIIAPFMAEKGSFGGLVDPRPSQKFSARGLVAYQIPNNNEFLMFIYPCIASNVQYPSLTLNYGTDNNMALATSTYTSSTAGNTPLNITQIQGITSTPYTEATLTTGQNNWRLLSAGIRVRYTGPNLYRGGLFKYYHDTRGDILNASELTTTTFSQIIQRLDGHAGVIRHNLGDDPVIEFSLPSVTNESQEWTDDGTQLWPGNKEYTKQRIGGTTSGILAGQPIGYIYGMNTTGQSLYFDAELIEHWEIAGRNVDALNTPSTGNAELANSLSTLVVSAHQHLAHNPSMGYHKALKMIYKDPHVRGAFSGIASNLATAVIAAL